MADPGAIRVTSMLDASPFIGGISNMVGGLNKMSNALKLGSLAVGYFAFKTLKAATQELVAFESEIIELRKVMGRDIAGPIGESIRRLSLTMPVARKELMEVAATAGRLGIRGRENILKFTEVVAKIGIATDVSAGVAAEALARLAKQTRMPISDMEGLGAAINELDNTMAVASSGIIDASSRSAAELSRLGFSVPEILALNAALAEVSESASRAGTRLNRVAQELGNPKKAKVFAEALGLVPEEFTKLRRANPLDALRQLIDVMREGGDTADQLASDLDSRARRALQQFAQNAEGVTHALAVANSEFKLAISLNREYAEYLDLVNSRTILLKNNVDELQLEIGEELRPAIIKAQEAFLGILQTWNKMFDQPLEGMLDKDKVDELRDKVYELWDTYEGGMTGIEYQTHRTFGTIQDHFLNLVNLFVEAEYQFTTWHKVNQQVQEDIVKAMSLVSDELRPTFFGMLNEEMSKSLAAGENLEEFYVRFNRISETFQALDLSQISGDKIGMGLFADQVQKLNAAVDLGVISWEAYQQAVQSTIDVAALNAMTMDEEAKKREKAKLQSEEMQEKIKKLVASLQDEINALTLTEEALFKVSEEYQNATEKQKELLLGKFHLLKKLEEEQEAWEKLKKEQERQDAAREASIQSYHDQEVALAGEIWARKQAIAGLQDYNRALFEASLWLDNNLTPAQRRNLLVMYDRNKALQDEMDLMEKKRKQEEKDAKEREKRAERMRAIVEKYTFATFESQLRLFERVVDDTADSLLDTFEALVTGSEDAGKAIIDMFKAILRALIKMQLQKFLFKTFGKLLFPEEWTKAFGGEDRGFSIPSYGPYAKGGRVQPNQLALIGEEGPELFVPDSSGTIVPNDRLLNIGAGLQGGGMLDDNVSTEEIVRIAQDMRRKLVTVGAMNKMISDELDRRQSEIHRFENLEIPKLAGGGKLRKGEFALVGERGPELFIPETTGTVTSNEKLENLGMGEINITNHYTIQALDGASVKEILTREQKTIAGITLDTISRRRALARGTT
jgi:TP901 family phage tail tape measure protein